MKKHERLTVFLITFSLLTVLSLPLSALLPTPEDAAIYDAVLRLHVLANSDSDEDQALKLRVRDGILETVTQIVADTDNIDAAKEAVFAQLSDISAAANAVLAAEGSSLTATVTLTRESYPTRVYEGDGSIVRLPAGEYTSLRVLIGEAKGQNWWCVLFPQLCVKVASSHDSVAIVDEADERMVEAGLTRSQIKLITGDEPEVVIRFRLLEWLKKWFG